EVWAGITGLGGEERTNYPLAVSVDDVGDGFTLTVQARAPIDPDQVCGLLATAVQELARSLTHSPQQALRDLDVLPASEHQQVVEAFNATGQPLPAGVLVHGLFEAQAARRPDATAVVRGEQSLTYGQLNARANQVAHRLRAMGVGPETRVGICAERSLELLVGIIATLKAGGAYVPLDPSYPAARISYMLTDSTPTVILTHGTSTAAGAGVTAVRDALQVTGVDVPVLALDGVLAGTLDNCPDTNPTDVHVGESDAAYVIYTSGSTGTPKGVVAEHRNTVNLINWA
ncbi:AMP-binding protein, partial [Streptomyces sp. NRRL S-813]|uniref:AMP-binding protein n=1 Tax=Streptomyces sp. NRRL S-813 TaxID=1463919 RepID=UPI0004C27254